jgi:hypothetical protein
VRDVIESFVEGRVRLRSPLLADEAFAVYLESELKEIPGVLRAEANARTNGLLLEYDREAIPLAALMRAAPVLTRIGGLEDVPPESRAALAGEILKGLREALGEGRLN